MTTTDSSITTPSQGERRLAVLLFADLSGYTRLCRTLDAEDVAATVLPLLAEVRSAVTVEGGIATGVAGDGFLAVFGVPVSTTDIADRAVRAARQMRQIVRARAALPGSLPVPDIHIGITAGEVLAFPSDDPSGLSFIGPAINLAARLSDAADAGSILVDDQLRQLLDDRSGLSAPRDLVLQGHEDGVRVWDLTDISAPSISLVASPPFIGRQELLRRLDDSWTQAAESRHVAVLPVQGEAGIGKTTLLRQWVIRDAAPRTVWLNCLDVSFSRHVEELLGQLRALAGVTARPPQQRQATTDLPLTRPGEDVTGQAREISALLSRIGEGVTCIIDDFQAADDELRAVVAALAGTSSLVPALLICVSRTDDTETLGDNDGVIVSPLDDEDITALVSAVLGADPPRPVVDALLTRSEGRPLAALQSSAYLVESGTVAVHDSRCVLLVPQQLSDLPDTVRLFVAGRLDRLPPAEKQLLQELSVVGTTAGDAVVERLFGSESHRLVDALVRRGFLVRGETELRFSHGVVHEVAYTSLPRAVRARIHRRVVEENILGDDAAQAVHARGWVAAVSDAQAAERRQAAAAALHYTRTHAQYLYAAHVRNAYAEARSVRQLIDDEADTAPAEVAQLLVLLARCAIHAGRLDLALAEASRAIELCRRWAIEPTVLVAALCAQGEALSQLRHYQSARQSLEEALNVAEATGDDRGRGRALLFLGDTYRHSDSQRLVDLTEEAFHLLAGCGDASGAAEAARAMAYWLSASTTPRLQRWIDEAERRTPIDDPRGRLELSRTAAVAACARLEYRTGREMGRACRDLGHTLGIADAVTDGLMIGVESAAALGHLAESLALLDELERTAASRAEPRVRQMASVVGLQPLQRAGEQARVADALAQVSTLRDAFGPPETTMAATALGLAARDRGAWGEAMSQLHVAVGASDDAGFALLSLVQRMDMILTAALLGTASPDAEEVAARAAAGGAPAIASGVRSALALVTGEVPPTAPATVQEAAVRADAKALYAERLGMSAVDAWQESAAAWAPLGLTVFLARAQARSGRMDDAATTLRMLHATDEGRDWALQR